MSGTKDIPQFRSKTYSEASKTDRMPDFSTFAFIGETPLKVFHALNFVMNDVMGSRGKSDMFIYGGFSNARQIYKAIRESGLFNRVYYFDDFVEKKTPIRKLRTAMQVFFPRFFLKRYSSTEIDFTVKYQYIAYAVPYPFSMCILQGFQHDSVIGIEDGLSSYFGDVLYHYRSKLLLLFNRICAKKKLIEPFEKLYLSNPSFFHGYVNAPVYQFPKIDIENIVGRQLLSVLGYRENDCYHNHRVVYLTQPYANKEFSDTERECLRRLKEVCKEDLIMRIHPRQMNSMNVIYAEEYHVDKINNIWELESLQQITDSHYLIGACSTAQITPKLICNKEPYLVFLYRIFCSSEEDNLEYKRATSIVQSFRELYRCKEKILEPNTLDELALLMMKQSN